jgi:class 3 adenylate cyclase
VSSDARSPTLPSGVVTFLFTDIEGSTLRWESDPDAMRVALASHDAVLQSVIEAHEGRLFKHTGDGVCAAFSSARCDAEPDRPCDVGRPRRPDPGCRFDR